MTRLVRCRRMPIRTSSDTLGHMRKLVLPLAGVLLACSSESGSVRNSESGGVSSAVDESRNASGGRSGLSSVTDRSSEWTGGRRTGGSPGVSGATVTRSSGGGSAQTAESTGGASGKASGQLGGAGASSGRSANKGGTAAQGSATAQTPGTTIAVGGAGAEDSGALDALGRYLALPRAERGPIDDQAFSQVSLSQVQAETAAKLLWDDYAKYIQQTRRAEHDARTIVQGQLKLRYWFKTFGEKPANGRSLFISLHGGGNADPSVNDEQWENQKSLYEPKEGIYLAPRAPTDTWNLWHESHIDPMFDRLIADLIVLEGVNPDRIYVMGYSAGGDGVYQLGPRMADYWAAAAAMAGHPNDAKPNSLRNIGFTIHVGALDTAYDRNLMAQQWNDLLDGLNAEDPAGYTHLVQVHDGKPHWMDLQDAVAVPWMAEFTRDPTPNTIVWYQDDVPHSRFYWLAVAPEQATAKTEARATCDGQRITLDTTGMTRIMVRLSDDLIDLDQPVAISANGRTLSPVNAQRRIAVIAKTLEERGDPRSIFSAEIEVPLSN